MTSDPATTHPGPASRQVQVLLPLPVAGAYDYRVPHGMLVRQGDFVTVPLGKRIEKGVVWGDGSHEVPEKKLKDISGLLEIPPMEAPMRRFIDWTASYTLSRPGAVLRMAMSVPAALDPVKPVTAYVIAPPPEESRIRMTRARASVLEAASDGLPRPVAELARAAGVSPAVIRGMAEAGLLSPVSITPETALPKPDWNRPGPPLSDAQREAAAALTDAVAKAAARPEEGFSVSVLDGVTGSGKTETYFEAIAACLENDRQALVLLPEIALTAQWLGRFEKRFGAPPLQWHSDLSAGERRRGWRAAESGEARVVVGARSALYLPFPHLGLIVVDEEHDAAFKQEDGVIYNARDMAVVRGRTGEFPVVLASATPSLETVVNIGSGRYRRLSLPERHGGAQFPSVEAVDMRTEPLDRQSWISPTLQDGMTQALEAGEQVMLYLNRRGYAPLTLCRHCGNRIDCPNCTAWLVEHRLQARLECHHCGFSMPLPDECPECGATESLVACGPGVERLAEEALERFPAARLDIMTSDTIRSPSAAFALVEKMQRHEIDILIGTQIVAKGHHFPNLTLVGVIDADLGLSGGDLRASERVYQTLHQVAGRAGRAEKPGHVVLQTYQPEHPIMQALVSGDRDRFLEVEAEARERHGMPPFGRLAALIVSGPDRERVDAAARELGRTRPLADGLNVLGPAEAPLAILRGRHRRRLLLKAGRDVRVQQIMRQWLSRADIPRGVRIQVDIDPYSFM